MVRNMIFEASLFPFDAVSLSYFVRSTCLLRTFNVLTSYDQRAYFVRSETKTSGVLGELLGLLGKNMWRNLPFDAGKHVF